MDPEIHFINEKEVFKRDAEDDVWFLFEPIKKSGNENKICKIQNLSDLTKIKYPIQFLTDEIGVEWPYIGNWCFLFTQDDEIKIKTMDDFVSIKQFETTFGLMKVVNKGEWGGALYHVTDNGLEKAGSGNFSHVFEYNDKLYAITNLAHLSLRESSLHEIKKFEDRFEDITIFECQDMMIDCCYLDENYLYFYSNPYNEYVGLFRLDLDNYQLETIHKDLFGSIHVNSILKQNDLFYLYGNYNLMKYNLNTGEMEFFTNLEQDEISKLYVGDMKLIDLWDDFIF